jgi:DNA repair protein RecO (recombination protein O)
MAVSLRDRLYQSNAIVLARQDYGEADRIFILYTPERGKLSAIAKGVRRPRSRMGPHLDYFSEVTLELAKGRDLDVVTHASTVNAHATLRSDMDAYGNAAHFAELVRHLTQDRQEHRQVYDLLASSLWLLNDGVSPWPVARHFELMLLGLLGFRPELFRCLNCLRTLEPEANAFSNQLGGLLCPNCRAVDPSAVVLSLDAQKYLRLLSRSGLSAVIGIIPPETVSGEIGSVLASYLRFVAERDFTSLGVLNSMHQGIGQRTPGSTLEP